MRLGEFWYRGTADAVFQNLNLVRDSRAKTIAVFGGDHVYKFAIDQMDAFHRDNEADLTVAAFPVPQREADQFGCVHVDSAGRIIGFVEKPPNPPELPDRPGWTLISMGNYLFKRDVLERALTEDATMPTSRHDFGRDVIPRLLSQGARVFAYDFASNHIPGDPEGALPYWRDVGTIDSYFTSNMELRSRVPAMDVYNRQWRIRTARRDFPPARLVVAGEGYGPAEVIDSLICEGSIVASARLRDVVLGYDCFVHGGAQVDESIVLSGCDIGSKSRLRRVLLDKNCKIEPGCVIGEDPAADRARFPFVTDSGIVLMPKGTQVPVSGPIVLANDVVELLHNEPELRAQLDPGSFTVATHHRHSYDSAGPRYERFGPRS
jgi:glucose-1-phosphate adenylyltransferase